MKSLIGRWGRRSFGVAMWGYQSVNEVVGWSVRSLGEFANWSVKLLICRWGCRSGRSRFCGLLYEGGLSFFFFLESCFLKTPKTTIWYITKRRQKIVSCIFHLDNKRSTKCVLHLFLSLKNEKHYQMRTKIRRTYFCNIIIFIICSTWTISQL